MFQYQSSLYRTIFKETVKSTYDGIQISVKSVKNSVQGISEVYIGEYQNISQAYTGQNSSTSTNQVYIGNIQRISQVFLGEYPKQQSSLRSILSKSTWFFNPPTCDHATGQELDGPGTEFRSRHGFPSCPGLSRGPKAPVHGVPCISRGLSRRVLVLTNHLLVRVVPGCERVGGTNPPFRCTAYVCHKLTLTYEIIIIFLNLWFLDENNKFRYL